MLAHVNAVEIVYSYRDFKKKVSSGSPESEQSTLWGTQITPTCIVPRFYIVFD